MLPDSKVKCPATAFARSCREIITECECPKFVHVQARDAKGDIVDKWGCVDSFLVLLAVEGVRASVQTGAAVESFRNEVAKAGEAAEQTKRDALTAFAKLGSPRLQVLE